MQADLGFVDALARLELEARRLGWSIRLVDPSPELCALLELVGLSEIVRVASEATGEGGSVLELGRQAERFEQLRVEEVVVPRDQTV